MAEQQPQYRSIALKGIAQPLLVPASWDNDQVDQYLNTSDGRQRTAAMAAQQGVLPMLKGAGLEALSQTASALSPLDLNAAQTLSQKLGQSAQNVYSGPTGLGDVGTAYDEGGFLHALGTTGKVLGYNAAIPLAPIAAGTLMGHPELGIAASLAGQAPVMFGSNVQQQYQQNPNETPDYGRAGLAMGGQLGLQALADIAMGGMNPASIAGKAGMEAAVPAVSGLGRFAQAAAPVVGRTALASGMDAAAMVGQTAIGRAQSGQELYSPEALSQYKESAGLGGLGGAIMRGATNSVDSYRLGRARDEIANQKVQADAAAKAQQQQVDAQQAVANAATAGQNFDLFGAPTEPAAATPPSPLDMAAQLTAYQAAMRDNYISQGVDATKADKLATKDTKAQAKLVAAQAAETPTPEQGALDFNQPAPTDTQLRIDAFKKDNAVPPNIDLGNQAVPLVNGITDPMRQQMANDARNAFAAASVNDQGLVTPPAPAAPTRAEQITQLAEQNAARQPLTQVPDPMAQAITQGVPLDQRAQMAADTTGVQRDLFGAPIDQQLRNAPPAENPVTVPEVPAAQTSLPFPITTQTDLFGAQDHGQTGQVDSTGQTPSAEGLRGETPENAIAGNTAATGTQDQMGQVQSDGRVAEPVVVRGGQTVDPNAPVKDQLQSIAQRNRADVAAGRTFSEDNVAAKNATKPTVEKLAPKVEQRMQDGADLPTALERLGADAATDKVKLTDTEHALARTAYQRITGKSLDEAVKQNANPPVQGELPLESPTVHAASEASKASEVNIKATDVPARGDAAAAWLGRQGSQPWVRELAGRLKPYLKDTPIHMITDGDPMPMEVRNALGSSTVQGVTLAYPDGHTEIYVRNMDGAPRESTLLHEMVHGAVEPAFAKLAPSHPLVRELESIRQQFLKDIPPGDAAPFAALMKDPSEFLAYVMSSPTLRAYAKDLPAYKTAPANYSVWHRFVNWVRKLLGTAPRKMEGVIDNGNGVILKAGPDGTAQMGFYKQMDSVLDQLMSARPEPTPRAPSDAAPTIHEANAAQSLGVPVDRVQQAKDIAKETAVKLGHFADMSTNKLIDSGHTVALKLNRAYAGKVRDANTNITNPELIMRQVGDISQLAKQVASTGKLIINEDGLSQVVPDANNLRAAAGTLAAGADRLGITKQAMRQNFDNYATSFRMQDMLAQIAKINTELAKGTGSKKQRAMAQDTVERLSRVVTKSQDQINADLALAKQMPELEAARKMTRETFRNAVDAAYNAGSLDAMQRESLNSSEGYIPFHRVFDEEEAGALPWSQMGGLSGAVKIYKIEGSDLAINDLMTNSLKMVDRLTQMAVRNNAGMKLAEGLVRTGDAAVIGKNDINRSNENRVVSYLRNGEKVNVLLNDALDADAFRPLGRIQSPVLNALRSVAGLIRAEVVLSPDFAPAQLLMDATTSGMLSGTKHPFKMTLDVLKEAMPLIRDAVKNKPSDDPWVQKLNSLGVTGRYDSVHITDPEVLRALNDAPSTAWGMVAQKGKNMVHLMERIAAGAEFAQRVAIAKRIELETGDPLDAYFRAHEIINYNRRGTSRTVGALMQAVPFMGAKISSTHLYLRSLAGRGLSNTDRITAIRGLARNIMQMQAAAMVYTWMTEDNKDIQDRPVIERYKNFYIPVGDKTLFALPVRPESALLFKWMPERLWGLYKNNGLTDDGKLAWKDIKDTTLDAALFSAPVPAGVKPIVENMLNHSFFTGKPVVSDYMANMPKDQQVNSGTSELAKMMGNLTGTSPIMLDNLLQGYMGPVASYSNAVAYHLVNAFSDQPQAARSYTDEPAIKRFFKDTGKGSQDMNDFYDMLAQTEGVAHAYKRASDEGRLGDVQNIMTNNYAQLQDNKALGQLNHQMQGINAAIRNIQASSIDNESKVMRIQALREVQKNIAEQAKVLRVRED